MELSPWIIFGFFAQFLFFMRFFIQWIASERRGESYIPTAFWYLSLAGSFGLLIYSVHKEDIVFILGFSLSSFFYIRNLILIYKKKKPNNKELFQNSSKNKAIQ